MEIIPLSQEKDFARFTMDTSNQTKQGHRPKHVWLDVDT